MQIGLQSLEKELKQLRSEMNDSFAQVNRKLDTLYEQVARDTEQEVKLNEAVDRPRQT